MSQVVLEPEVKNPGTGGGRWMVVMFNNDHNSMDEVIEVLMIATGCDVQEAYIEMWEAHNFGKASVHFAGHEECAQVAEIIAQIGVKTEVTKEWPE